MQMDLLLKRKVRPQAMMLPAGPSVYIECVSSDKIRHESRVGERDRAVRCVGARVSDGSFPTLLQKLAKKMVSCQYAMMQGQDKHFHRL